MSKMLIISNNCLSTINNNGKTLYNIFDKMIKDNKVCSIYFSYEKSLINIPTLNLNEKKLLRIKHKEIDNNSNLNHQISECMRLGREIIWLIPSWKKKIKEFVKKNNVHTFFFLAGDSIFAYRIALYIKKRFDLNMLIYYTDDYYFKHYFNIFGFIRKKILSFYIKKSIKKSNELYVISPSMKSHYDKVFNKNAKLLGISLPPLENKYIYHDNINLTFTYIGNLGIGRFETIYRLAKILNKINQKQKRNYKIEIYTNSSLSYYQKNLLLKMENVLLSGGLDKEEVNKKMNESDFLIFVESFDKSMIEITRYSFSTKIMEYLSTLKPIISIGSIESSSIQILSNCSISLKNNNYNDYDLYKMIKDEKMINSNIEKSKALFELLNDTFKLSKKEIYKFNED